MIDEPFGNSTCPSARFHSLAFSAASPETATGEAVDEAGLPGPAPELQSEVGGGAAPGGEQRADATEDEEALKADYRKIAERRVRLGLLLAEVGRNNNITVSPEKLNQALTQEARRHPGYERQVIDYYRNNPDALNNLRAPIFEEKVVDFIVELAKPEERSVTPQELMTMTAGEADGESATPE